MKDDRLEGIIIDSKLYQYWIGEVIDYSGVEKVLAKAIRADGYIHRSEIELDKDEIVSCVIKWMQSWRNSGHENLDDGLCVYDREFKAWIKKGISAALASGDIVKEL